MLTVETSTSLIRSDDDPVRDPIPDLVLDAVQDPDRDPVSYPIHDQVHNPIRDPVCDPIRSYRGLVNAVIGFRDPVRHPVHEPVRYPIRDPVLAPPRSYLGFVKASELLLQNTELTVAILDALSNLNLREFNSYDLQFLVDFSYL